MGIMAAGILRKLRRCTWLSAGLLGAPALLIAGCTVGPDYHPTKTETRTPGRLGRHHRGRARPDERRDDRDGPASANGGAS